MNTDALFVGMNIKNYKELCMLTNEETKTGKSKILQLENFSRFINWHKIGQKFIIDEIYDSPKEKQDKRSSGNNNVYCKYIEIILLNHLSHCDNNVNSLTFCKWYEILGMVGHDYNKYYSDMDKLLEFEDNLDIIPVLSLDLKTILNSNLPLPSSLTGTSNPSQVDVATDPTILASSL